MTKREQLIEQYEDALFALLMDSVAEEEGKKAIELNERLKADPEAEVPGLDYIILGLMPTGIGGS